MFYWVAKNSKFPVDKWRFNKTDTHCSVFLSKRNVFLLIYYKLKKTFIAKNQLLYMRCPLTRERKQIFKSVCFRLRECANAAFDWALKRGFEKGVRK